MPLFQTAVLHKYLKQQESARMATAYAAFRAHFHDAAVQANMRIARAQALQAHSAWPVQQIADIDVDR